MTIGSAQSAVESRTVDFHTTQRSPVCAAHRGVTPTFGTQKTPRPNDALPMMAGSCAAPPIVAATAATSRRAG